MTEHPRIEVDPDIMVGKPVIRGTRITVELIVRRFADGWRAGLRLSLSGELKAEALAGLAAPGVRLGVHPHGALARAVGEELAFLDPPGEDGDSCAPLSCPFAGVGSCCDGRPSCSVATNGSGSARYFVQCLQ